MYCSEVKSVAWRFGVALLATLGLSASAQQPIQFSQPVGSDPIKSANAFLPDTKHLDPGNYNAPILPFGGGPTASFDILPGSPPPILYNANPEQWRKFLNDKKNWTLMTPEEIMGIPTPEKIMGVADPNDDPTLLPEERYLKRHDREEAAALTNGVQRTDMLFGKEEDPTASIFHSPDAMSPFAKSLDGSASGKTHELGSIFAPHPNQSDDASPKMDSAWTSPFDHPEPLPKPTVEQIAEMERFRAIMDPPTPDKPQSGGLFGTPAPAPVDPNMQARPTSFNPVGQSVAPLRNDIARPTGLTPLPGVTGPLPTPKPPPPLVQPPPWMQSSLQNPIMPQRQF
jgi:hypothetical protein